MSDSVILVFDKYKIKKILDGLFVTLVLESDYLLLC